MRKLIDFLFESEFYLKVTLSCAFLQQLFYWLLRDQSLDFLPQVIIYWLLGSISFYAIGWLIETKIKSNQKLATQLNARVRQVKTQPFPRSAIKAAIIGQVKSFLAALIILYIAPEVYRGNAILLNIGWFLFRIILADLCFYLAHRLLHQKRWQKIHLKHHEYRDTSSFVAGHKSLTEYIIVTITDLLPIFILGYDITQLLAWTIIGNAYNLEGHSSLSIFFISSDFHDLHHTDYHKNYGIQGFWDRVFNTLNTPHKKPSLASPIALIEKRLFESAE
ncbi:MAG: sterol desaturase family protein [Cyanobacteria bacterium P01_C01_bin.72]